jgi:hypothetical protein
MKYIHADNSAGLGAARVRNRFPPLTIGTCAVGFVALMSCVDPFAFDKAPVHGDASTPGAVPAMPGTGGAPGSVGSPTGAADQSGGASGSLTGAGGTIDPAGTSGTSGGPSAAGAMGTAGVTGTRVAGMGGITAMGGANGGAATAGTGATTTGMAGSNGDGGVADAAAGTGAAPLPAPVQPPEPFANLNQCPPDPPIPNGGTLTCPANLAEIANWFPTTPPMQQGGGCQPLPHPAGECRFYTQSWQEFLLATQPDASGRPAFLGWNTIENTFGAGAGKPSPAIPVLSAGVTQAGGRQIVIDQNGQAIYYSIHMNPALVAFINEAHLTSADQIKRASPNLHFTTTTALVETKDAWQIVSDVNPPQAASFITTQAMVPTLSVDPLLGVIADDAHLRMVTVALIAIHIVHTIPGHPEFIWSSFQHANRATGVTDLAPSAIDLPSLTPNTAAGVAPQLPAGGYILYARNTIPANANRGVFIPSLNAATQTFTTPPTSIFRVFPGSKSTDPAVDDDVAATNEAMTTRFNVTNPRPAANDRRPNYRLVGAVWQDVPSATFKVNNILVNNQADRDIILNGSDSINSITGGEERLSSTAMESFTQGETSFPNCFHCHDTRSTAGNGVPQARNPGSPAVMQPGLINVSHIFNEVVRLKIN